MKGKKREEIGIKMNKILREIRKDFLEMFLGRKPS
jgi:hypothetical protein